MVVDQSTLDRGQSKSQYRVKYRYKIATRSLQYPQFKMQPIRTILQLFIIIMFRLKLGCLGFNFITIIILYPCPVYHDYFPHAFKKVCLAFFSVPAVFSVPGGSPAVSRRFPGGF